MISEADEKNVEVQSGKGMEKVSLPGLWDLFFRCFGEFSLVDIKVWSLYNNSYVCGWKCISGPSRQMSLLE